MQIISACLKARNHPILLFLCANQRQALNLCTIAHVLRSLDGAADTALATKTVNGLVTVFTWAVVQDFQIKNTAKEPLHDH